MSVSKHVWWCQVSEQLWCCRSPTASVFGYVSLLYPTGNLHVGLCQTNMLEKHHSKHLDGEEVLCLLELFNISVSKISLVSQQSANNEI